MRAFRMTAYSLRNLCLLLPDESERKDIQAQTVETSLVYTSGERTSVNPFLRRPRLPRESQSQTGSTEVLDGSRSDPFRKDSTEMENLLFQSI
jgi:hypothetical protein